MKNIPSLVLLALLAFSCSSIDSSLSMGEYDVIISKYAGSLEKNDPEINYQVAEAYRKSNRIKEALPFYKSAVEEGVIEQDAYYYFARAYKANQEYDKAQEVLEENLTRITDEQVKKLVENELKNLTSLDEIKNSENFYRIRNLSDINTPNAEYAPVFIRDFLYFTSNREGGKIYKSTGTPFTDIYRIRSRGANVRMETLQALDEMINDPAVNEGTQTVTKDGRTLIFAKGNTGKATGNNEVNLYFTIFRNGRWLEPRPLSINNPDSWDSTPMLSPDGTTLYFSSNRPGGYGGTDIYSAKRNRRGRWVDVRNMGPEINTPGNEMFPFVSEDGSLYFASDGHPGFGNLDIFRATRQGGLISIRNLGEPMNSSADDFAYHEYDLTRGFFSSNRREGKGDDDIFTYVNDDPDLKIVNYFLDGITATYNDAGEEIIVANSKVTLVGENGSILDEAFTTIDGEFRFRVYAEEKYNLIAEKTDYFTTRKEFTTVGKSIRKDTLTELITNVEFNTKIFLDRIVIDKPIVLENIYYDLDEYYIREDAKPILDSLVTIMEDNPEIFVELGSHTDARAPDDYNMDLSRKRALSAVEYIISRGIEPERITAKGYGETQLIISNAETEEEHQVNRRTEFKVLRYNPRETTNDVVDDDDLDEYERFFEEEGGLNEGN